jgi:tRNA pseudouridine65 synthase
MRPTDPAALRILWQDSRTVAIDKPAGLLVHPTGLDAGETRFAVHELSLQLGRKVWPVHRLDKGTSGVLVFALDADSARQWSEAFGQGQVRKTYHAIVRGWPDDQGCIDHPLRREDETSSRTLRREQVQDALTHYRTLQRLTLPIADRRPDGQHFEHTRVALVELHPVTGRRHQLRRHMKHIAHPIIGDATHGKGPLNRSVAQHLGWSRLWLHASALEIALAGPEHFIREIRSPEDLGRLFSGSLPPAMPGSPH